MRAPARCAVAVLAGLALGAGAVGVARLSAVDLPGAVALPAGLACGVLAAVLLRLPPAGAVPLEPPAEDRTTAAASSLADLAGLHFAVRAAGSDPDRFEQRIRPRLCGVAVERLWQRHGLDWRTPDGRAAARAVLGPQTWALLTAPPHALRLTPASRSAWLDELETL